MLQALDESGITPDLVLGASIGAFNGSVIADQPGRHGVEMLSGLWAEITAADLLQGGRLDRIKKVAMLRPALHETSELRSLLERVHSPDRQIEDLAIPFQCVAASIERAAEHWFTTGRVVDAVVASAAVPGLLRPARVGDEHYLDGGIVNSIPVGRAVEQGADRIFVLQVGRVDRPLTVPRKPWDVARVSFEIARRHRFHREMAALPEHVTAHVLPTGGAGPKDDSLLSYRDFKGVVRRIDAAYRASVAYLDEAGL